MRNITLSFARTYSNHWYLATNGKVFYAPELFWALMRDSDAVKAWCDRNRVRYTDLSARLKQKSKVWFVGETKIYNPNSQKLAREITKSLKTRVATDEVKELLSEAERIPCESEYDIIDLHSLLFKQPATVSTLDTVEDHKNTDYNEQIENLKLEILQTKLRILQAQVA